jgi:glutamine amidotransferase
MIAIINYGLGNIRAFANVYKTLNVPCFIASSAADLKSASRIILPGVGAFDHAMQRFENSGMRNELAELVRGKGLPVLGVCVGMQMLAGSSEEGSLPGLGWIDARVKRFDLAASNIHAHVPHMGWNNVMPMSTEGLFGKLEQGSRFYFLHSYYFEPQNAEDILAQTDYYGTFTSAVRHKNVFGVQFHPEKSHQWGVQLLKNFAEL